MTATRRGGLGGAVRNRTLVGRLAARLREDIAIVRLVENWPTLLHAKAARCPVEEVRLRNGSVLQAPPNVSLAFLFHEIWVDEIYRPAAGGGIRRGETVVDIGANIGTFAAWAACRAPEVRVIAYEPNRLCLPWLRDNVRSLGRVTVHAQAVGGHSGPRGFKMSDNWLLPTLADDGVASETVDCITLQEAFERDGISCCDLLKLDCEGAEYEILLEAPASILRQVRRIVAEYHPSPAGDRATLFRRLADQSLRVDRLVETGEREGYFHASRA